MTVRRSFFDFLHTAVVLFGYVETEYPNKGRAWWFRPVGLALLALCLIAVAVAVSVALG